MKPHSWRLRPERPSLGLAAHCTDLSLPSSPSIEGIFCSGGISGPEREAWNTDVVGAAGVG